ncbi:hypothetical protein SAMN05216207_1004135 [Pseudonocardia ammonioxydans]|uniref:Rhomboid family protein n=1 Tax=Pseudonocardia ammonioxydans TaxID=260086 RepID=A0A1I4UK61_PSUAM|nr:hypothetical protein [Pseudonocardia ammonioxydans]SFM89120.1 hypothetical protein SAMN05216207_1004135 [Pseudonocardia ammonioxydans]
MTTSGTGWANVLGVVLVLGAVVAVAAGPGGRFRPTLAGAGLWLLVAVPSLAQLAVPGLLDALARVPELIRAGQVWRLATSVVVQDGGAAGTASNLVLLAVVVCAAVPASGPARSWALFLGGAVAFDLVTTFAFPSTGAGNSAATYVLGCALLGLRLVRGRTSRSVTAAVVAGATGVALLVVRDAHGFAVLGGLAAGTVLAWSAPPPAPDPLTC